MQCENCQTEISGSYKLPATLRLSKEDQQLILQFVKFSGSIKEMAKYLDLSYPTVRNLLDDLIERLKTEEENAK